AVAAWFLLLILFLIDRLIGTNLGMRGLRGFNTTFFPAFFVASCIGLVLIFILMSRLFLARSWRYVADRERTRHWHTEPFYRRARRPDPEIGRLYHFPPSRQ